MCINFQSQLQEHFGALIEGIPAFFSFLYFKEGEGGLQSSGNVGMVGLEPGVCATALSNWTTP